MQAVSNLLPIEKEGQLSDRMRVEWVTVVRCFGQNTLMPVTGHGRKSPMVAHEQLCCSCRSLLHAVKERSDEKPAPRSAGLDLGFRWLFPPVAALLAIFTPLLASLHLNSLASVIGSLEARRATLPSPVAGPLVTRPVMLLTTVRTCSDRG